MRKFFIIAMLLTLTGCETVNHYAEIDRCDYRDITCDASQAYKGARDRND